MNTLLDLVEDEESLVSEYFMNLVILYIQVRQPAIKSLPEICKNSNDATLCTKVADVLTQLLVSGCVLSILL